MVRKPLCLPLVTGSQVHEAQAHFTAEGRVELQAAVFMRTVTFVVIHVTGTPVRNPWLRGGRGSWVGDLGSGGVRRGCPIPEGPGVLEGLAMPTEGSARCVGGREMSTHRFEGGSG